MVISKFGINTWKQNLKITKNNLLINELLRQFDVSQETTSLWISCDQRGSVQ